MAEVKNIQRDGSQPLTLNCDCGKQTCPICATITEVSELTEPSGMMIAPKQTLMDIETTLQALAEVDPNDLTEELRVEYKNDLARALLFAKDKRDRVAFKIHDMSMQADLADAMFESLTERAAMYKKRGDRFRAGMDRLKDYVLEVIKNAVEKPAKGPRKLEGESVTLKASGVGDSIDPTTFDEAQIPLDYKRTRFITTVDRDAVLAVLKRGEKVPGATLLTDKVRLVIE